MQRSPTVWFLNMLIGAITYLKESFTRSQYPSCTSWFCKLQDEPELDDTTDPVQTRGGPRHLVQPGSSQVVFCSLLQFIKGFYFCEGLLLLLPIFCSSSLNIKKQ